MRYLTLLLPLALACRGGSDTQITHVDADGDGFAAEDDCNDDDAAVSPDGVEVCNGVDDDCSGEIDDDAQDAQVFYQDRDGDGYGDPASTVEACDPPAGYVADATDCDDGDRDFHPGASEEDCADPEDYNCDGSTGYADEDGDGFPACQDCDDALAAVNPDAVEDCDGVDDDCDGQTDEAGAVGEQTWHADDDGDGYGDPLDRVTSCEAPDGYVSDDRDCNDGAAEAKPGGVEVCDGLDNDCDARTDEADAEDAATWYVDADRDGFGSADVEQVACKRPSGFVDNTDDCDDGEATTNPDADETCDEEDDDCDGEVDEGFDTTWYLDYDDDGHGDPGRSLELCDAPDGYVAAGDDCDDTDAAYHPDAAPGCDGLDYDCDGEVDNDADGDGYADMACGGDDCDDDDASIKPEHGGGCVLGGSCLEILDKGRSGGDGVYTIDPDGTGGDDAFEVWCDMTTADGGWTLVYSHATQKSDEAELNTGLTELINDFVSPEGPGLDSNFRVPLERWNAIASQEELLYRATDKLSGPSGAPFDLWILQTHTSLDPADSYRIVHTEETTLQKSTPCLQEKVLLDHTEGPLAASASTHGLWATPGHCAGGPPFPNIGCWCLNLGTPDGRITPSSCGTGNVSGNLFYHSGDASMRCGSDPGALANTQYGSVGLLVR